MFKKSNYHMILSDALSHSVRWTVERCDERRLMMRDQALGIALRAAGVNSPVNSLRNLAARHAAASTHAAANPPRWLR